MIAKKWLLSLKKVIFYQQMPKSKDYWPHRQKFGQEMIFTKINDSVYNILHLLVNYYFLMIRPLVCTNNKINFSGC